MAKKKRKRRRSTTEKIVIVLGIIIVLSMMLSLFVGQASRRANSSQAPLPAGWDEGDERLYPVRSQSIPPTSFIKIELNSGEPPS